MCFHNALSLIATDIENRYDARFKDKTVFKPIYRGSGFTFMQWAVITAEAPDTINLYNWGLVPYWTKNREDASSIRALTLNAKSETLFEKASFKYAITHKRCLVLSSGFFEWQHVGAKKYPYFIHSKEQALFSMGGVYSEWTDKESGEIFNTFSIITTPANKLMAQIHNTKKRMPLILLRAEERAWLESHLTQAQIMPFLRPVDDNFLEAHTVSPLVSSPKGNSNVPDVQKPYTYPEFNQLF